MGVLDDAIREHLELKRKHGASDTELAQAEAEALGPARRDALGASEPVALEPEPVEERAVEDLPPPAGDPVAAEEEPGADRAEPAAAEGEQAAPEGDVEFAADEVPVEERLDGPEPAAAAAEPEPVVEAEAEPMADSELPAAEKSDSAPGDTVVSRTIEPEPEPDEPATEVMGGAAPAESESGPPTDPSLEPARDEPGADLPPGEGGGQASAGEDLLEETPDFLQETPEHDRLWFEQKPPRDFDFDD